jgi:hypothetical protein
MKKWLILLIIVALVSGSLMFYKKRNLINGVEITETLLWRDEVTRFPMMVSIGNKTKIGLSTDVGILNFGFLPTGSSERKVISLENEINRTAIVKITTRGNISEFVNIETERFILKPNERTEVMITLNATKEGNFTGFLIIHTRRWKYTWLEKFGFLF